MNEIMWYGWCAEKLRTEFKLEVPLQTFPDGLYAHEPIWKGFAIDQLGLNDETIVISQSAFLMSLLTFLKTAASTIPRSLSLGMTPLLCRL